MVTVAVDATPLLGRPTGVGVAVRGLLGALGGRELDLVAFAQTGTGWRRVAARLPGGVRYAPRPMPAAVVQRAWRRLDSPPVEWWTGPADVVHGTNFVVPPSRDATRLVAVWDLTAVRYPELCTPAARRYPRLIRRALDGGAAVHTASRSVAAEICEHFGVDADRVHVVPLGITPRPAAPPSHAVAAPYILGLGTVEPRKDFPLLVRAFDRMAGDHPGLELRIVGPDGWGSEALGVAVAGAAHAARIRRVGWVADTAAVMAGATVFAYPSVYEGFGLPPLEAMAAGVPVVATSVGAVPEVVGDAADLVAGGDVDALAAALSRAVDDDAHRRRLVLAGAARVREFSWEAAGSLLAQLYRRLASDGASRS